VSRPRQSVCCTADVSCNKEGEAIDGSSPKAGACTHPHTQPVCPAAAQVDLDTLSRQLRQAGSKHAKTNTFDALSERDAWVDLEDFLERSHAFIEDAANALRPPRLRDPVELAILSGNAALLSLSGAHTPHHRAGQLETLVIVPNKDNLRCIYAHVRSHPPAVGAARGTGPSQRNTTQCRHNRSPRQSGAAEPVNEARQQQRSAVPQAHIQYPPPLLPPPVPQPQHVRREHSHQD
jgi:hypothetical protein